MTSYLKERLCNGLAPQRVNAAGAFMRDALVSRMMMDRKKIRLICAPSGMGKTTLAFLYAHLVFSFENVLWLDVSHPCALRDLDDGTLAERICQEVDPGGLVVLEDVPRFGTFRRQRFSAVCDDVLSHGCEVVVTAIPDCDPFEGDWADCLVLASGDMLYSDAELEQMRARGMIDSQLGASRALLQRVPLVKDRASGGVEAFLTAQFAEARSSFEMALTAAIALLGSGKVEDLASAVGSEVTVDDLRVSDVRPYVSLREFRCRFAAEGFPLEDVLRAFRPYEGAACRDLPGSDPESFLCRVADVMLRGKQFDRAARLIVTGCSPAARAIWLSRAQDILLEEACPISVVTINRSLGRGVVSHYPRLILGYGYALCLLSDAHEGVKNLLTVARRRDAKPRERLRAATIAALFSPNHPARLALGDSFGECCLSASGKEGNLASLAAFWNAVLEGDTGMAALMRLSQRETPDGDWLLAAACCLRCIGSVRDREGLDATEARLLKPFLSAVAKSVEASVSSGALATTSYLASQALLEMGKDAPVLPRTAMAHLGLTESRLQNHAEAYGKHFEPSEQAQAPSEKSPMESAGQIQKVEVIMPAPTLEVRLFGGFDVAIGGQPADAEKLSRLKVRALLALLVLNAGKDLSCEHLGTMLWPDSVPDKARRNFYSIYSMLNRALTTPDGHSPYLVRSQGVCRLSSASLKSDAQELTELCNVIRFSRLSPDDAYSLLERLRRVYRGELLPGETAVPAMAAVRAQWRSRVTDCVLFAARDLQGRGEVPIALEYAKSAVAIDERREDCYELLMVLQMTCGQRTNAVETFFTYQRMNAEMGLGVSARMMELYNCILDDVQSFRLSPKQAPSPAPQLAFA